MSENDVASELRRHGIKRVDRRRFLQTSGAVVAASSIPVWAQAKESTSQVSSAESGVKSLHESLNEQQRAKICLPWDYMHPKRGLLRTRVENNWNITDETINGDFFTADQQDMIRGIFESIINPDWHERLDKQMEDDMGGWGEGQAIAIFGDPDGEKFEFVLTGRHMTLRCDGNSSDHVAFGGPIFYGHAADGFHEGPMHPGNVFWPQAVMANKLYEMLDGKQRELALVKKSPIEKRVGFRAAKSEIPGIPVTEFGPDQKEHLQKVMQKLIEPYRQTDRDEVVACLKAQGGLDACRLSFYQDADIGNDQVWDNWRLEGPSFVWFFRGSPHVHVWVNVADDPSVKLNS